MALVPADCCPWDTAAAHLTPGQRRCVRAIEIGLTLATIALLIAALSYADDATGAAGISLLVLGAREAARALLAHCVRKKAAG